MGRKAPLVRCTPPLRARPQLWPGPVTSQPSLWPDSRPEDMADHLQIVRIKASDWSKVTWRLLIGLQHLPVYGGLHVEVLAQLAGVVHSESLRHGHN